MLVSILDNNTDVNIIGTCVNDVKIGLDIQDFLPQNPKISFITLSNFTFYRKSLIIFSDGTQLQ